MSHRRCCCCPGQTGGTYYQTGHRDLTTGLQWDHPQINPDIIDGVDLIWSLNDGDVTGLTQQTIAIGCTAGTVTVGQGAGVSSAFSYAAPGSLRIELSGFEPTQKGFCFGQIIWSGEHFNAADHVAHIAAGSLHTAVTRKFQIGDTSLNRLYFGLSTAPAYVFGHAAKAPDGTVFLSAVFDFDRGLLGGWGDDEKLSCWIGGNATGWQVIDPTGGYLRAATADELRAYGLQIDPLTVNTTVEVGFFFGIASRSDAWTGNLSDFSYDCKVDVDDIGIHAIWALNCVAAFYGKATLTGSITNAFAASGSAQNLAPIEMLGMTWSLSLTTLPDFVRGTHANTLEAMHDAGYCYTDTQSASNGIEVTVWYLPCNRLVLQFHDNGTVGCDVYIPIMHDAGTWSQWSDGTGGSVVGEYGPGTATAPAFAGASEINFCVPPHNHPCPHQISGLPDLSSIEWHGVDCLSAPPGGNYFLINSHRIQCVGNFPGAPAPQCVQGLLPNQLTWMTDCYSLYPIAIGYRKRVQDLIGGNGWNGELCHDDFGTITNLCEAPVNFGNPPITHTGTPFCWATRLKLMGFTDQIDDLDVDHGQTTYYFYVDITE